MAVSRDALGEAEPAVSIDEAGTIRLGPRAIPLPRSISDQARAVLNAPRHPPPRYPSPGDRDGWQELIADRNRMFEELIALALKTIDGRATIETQTVAGVTVHVGTPTEIPDANRDRVWMTLHGGAFILMGGAWARGEAGLTAADWDCVCYSVDYRMPPDHPFPAGVDDAVAVYRHLLKTHEPGDIVISGASAGGNIAPAALLKARDLGLPLPGAVILNSPACDLTESGDTVHTLRHLDPRMPLPLPETIALYADGHDLVDPYLSPLFADFAAGFPPTYIQTGTRDLFLSNCVRLHRALRKAEIEAELHVWEAGLHGGFYLSGAPEADEEHAEQARFLAKHWGAGRGDA
jgi:acetyl esterase/lipase